MKFWQAVTWAETDQLVEIAKFAEELGFHGVMSGDHALYPKEMRPDYPYSDTGYPPQTAQSEYPDQWALFGAMAAVTKQIKFTCGVYVLPLRHPIEVAKACATLAILSEGRFILGAGAGWMREEFDIYGVDFSTRGKRLDEMLPILEKLWRPGMVEHHGEFFDFPKIQLSPAPNHKIPVYIGGANKLALKRTAKYGDGWIGAGNHPKDVPDLMKELQRLRAEVGRDHLPFETMVGLHAPIELDTFKNMEGSGMTSGLNMPFAFKLGEQSTLDEKKFFMEDFAERIIRHMPERQ